MQFLKETSLNGFKKSITNTNVFLTFKMMIHTPQFKIYCLLAFAFSVFYGVNFHII